MAPEPEKRVLSIQSHVVHGHVGNKSAVFPLQLLGFEVDFINSVQFSNHTGYGNWTGQVMDEQQLDELVKGLRENKINYYTHVLTGYNRNKGFLTKIGEVIQELKQINPKLTYVCDPVMGDHGKLYVPEELVAVYRDIIVPLSDICTPNQFELGLLTDMVVETEEDTFEAIDELHKKGIKTIVITSTNFAKKDNDKGNFLVTLASQCIGTQKKTIKLSYEKLPLVFTGTGDLFAALLLAWMHKSGNDVKVACEKTLNTLQDVIANTYKYTLSVTKGKKPTKDQLELKLVASKANIENPSDKIKAETFSDAVKKSGCKPKAT